jgi:hypothetical protein
MRKFPAVFNTTTAHWIILNSYFWIESFPTVRLWERPRGQMYRGEDILWRPAALLNIPLRLARFLLAILIMQRIVLYYNLLLVRQQPQKKQKSGQYSNTHV